MPESIESSTKSVTIMAQPSAENNLFAQEDIWHNKIAERAFAYYQDRGSVDGYDWADWVAAESELLKSIALEIRESEDSYIVSAEVPGFSAKELEIQLDGTRMLIHGAKFSDQSTEGATERTSKPVYRLIEFSFPIAADGSRAQAEDGILQVTLPKSKEQSVSPAATD